MEQAVAILHPVQDLTAKFVIPNDIRLAAFTEPGAIEPWLDHVRKSVAGFVSDTSTARGRANIKSMAFEVTKSKSYLTKVGKELADEQKAIPKLIDATRKHITDTLEALAIEVRKPLTDWEVADEARVTGHRHAIQNFALLSEPKSDGGAALNAEQLWGNLRIIEAMPVDAETCEEFLAEYSRAKAAALTILNGLIPLREELEADAAELIELRAAAAARDERDRFEADMLEKAEAEKVRAGQAAARKVEDDRKAAEAAEQLVRETEARVLREAAEELAREEAAAATLARNIDHRRAVNNEVLLDLAAGGIPDDIARKAISLIASGAVRNVTIKY